MRHKRGCRAGLALAVCMLTGTAAGAQSTRSVGVDHIILYTGSLTEGRAAFERLTGVAPMMGGQHPGRGTQNALVSLGEGLYLELLAPITDSGPAEPLRPTGWAVRTTDLAALRERLASAQIQLSDAAPGSRQKPDGGLLTWRTSNVVGADSPLTPFFIQWGADVPHPSTTSPRGCSLVEFVITEPDTTRLDRLVQTLDLAVQVRPGATRGASLTLRCPRGEVRFTS